jgi:aspartate aminotransferase
MLSERIKNMRESATLKMASLARALKSQGVDVIDLSLGEPDFDTPQHIKDAAKEALDAGYTKYTPVAGLLELREAICEKFQRDNDLHFQASQIVVSNGAKQSIANLCLSLLDPGDEAVVFSPYWVSYAEIIHLAEGVFVPVYAGVEQDFKVLPEQLEAAITPKTKIVLFSSPCNPTGSVYGRDELAALVQVLAKYPNIVVIADEIYEYIHFSGKHLSIGTFEAIRDRTVTVNGFSKGFAMTGWRLGYIGAPQWIADACTKIQGQFTSGAASFSQRAATVALRSDQSATQQMNDAFRQRRDLVVAALEKIPGIKTNKPEGAFYCFPDVTHFFGKKHEGRTIQHANDLCMYLLQEAHVSVVEGDAFGAPNCIRLSYATSPEKLTEALSRMAEALAKLS